MYKGVPIRTAADASRYFGRNENYIGKIMRTRGYDIKGAVDYALENNDRRREINNPLVFNEKQLEWLSCNSKNYTIKEIRDLFAPNYDYSTVYRKIEKMGLVVKKNK